MKMHVIYIYSMESPLIFQETVLIHNENVCCVYSLELLHRGDYFYLVKPPTISNKNLPSVIFFVKPPSISNNLTTVVL